MACNPEYAAIGSILIDPSQYNAVAALISEDDFGDIKARTVFRVIKNMVLDGTNIDHVLVLAELRRSGELEAIGGSVGLASFLDAPTSAANAKYYAENVSRGSRERRIKTAIANAHQSVVGGEDIESVFSDLKSELKNAEVKDARRLEARPIGEIIWDCLDPQKKRDLISTGYERLDIKHGGGIARGSLTVIGAAPSVGKTQFAINLIPKLRINNNNARVLHVSMEMGEGEMSQRLVSLQGDLYTSTAKTFFQATVSKQAIETFGSKFECGVANATSLPMRMICGSFTAEELRSIAYHYSGRFDVMIVDYLQRCRGEKGQAKIDRVEAASKACKDIAMEHDVAVIAIASLNRDGYRDHAVKPDLPHLRESGNIEFDADNIWMLWREKDDKVFKEDLELYIRKQRNGPIAMELFEFDVSTGRIWEKNVEY